MYSEPLLSVQVYKRFVDSIRLLNADKSSIYCRLVSFNITSMLQMAKSIDG